MTKQSLNIYQRLNAVMTELAYVQKENKKVNNQYTFVSHDAVTAAVRGPMVKFGILPIPTVISCVREGNMTIMELQVDFVNIDKPDDRVVTTSFGYGIDPQDKGVGKARSYAIKYAYLQQFALATGDDPERDSINFSGNKISELQVDKLVHLLGKTKSNVPAYLRVVGVKSLQDISENKFDTALLMLEKKLATLKSADAIHAPKKEKQ